ncbi:MAG: hypothetical protein ABEL97_10385 [Salinibacter sp.]
MTDEEFERLKAAEKDRLRAQKRLRGTLEALKRRHRSRTVVEKMKRGAERLLDETDSLVDALRRTGARRTGRLEVALDDEAALDADEQALREERAETLLRRYKAAHSPGDRADRSGEPEAPDADPTADGPDKTIGRMRTPRSDEETS